MKLFIIIIPCLLLSVLVPAQTISPNVNTEFCPKN